MKPLCEKIYFVKIAEIVFLLFGLFMDAMFIINRVNEPLWLVMIISLTALLIWMSVDSIYWAFQPRVLIYQYETGIVIGRNIQIEYTSIESIKYKNYFWKEPRGNYYKDFWSGIIFIKLKSGKIYKIRNASCPIEAVDAIARIKQQKKYR